MSGFLLDTNVISELIKPRPDPTVTRWIDATDESLLCLSVLTLGEIRLPARCVSPYLSGNMARPQPRSALCGRILVIDQAVADRWGRIAAKALAGKSPLPVK